MRCLTAILMLFTVTVQSANILMVIPFHSFSHQLPLLSLSKALAQRGHNLTVMTTNPPKENIPNYNVIDLSSSYKHSATYEKEFGFSFQKEYNAFQFIGFFPNVLESLCDFQLSLPQMKNFIRNAENTKFDTVIIENLFFSSYLGLVHKMGSPPVIGVNTFPRWGPADWVMGVPANPSYIPDLMSDCLDEMGFFDRLYNTVMRWWSLYLIEMKVFPYQDKIIRKHFGDGLPSAREMESNKSLIIAPSDTAVDHSVPEPPNKVSVGALHIDPPKPLPKDIQEWIDGAEEGAVYFSFGSNKKGSEFPAEKREAFVKAFAKFPKIRFLWKWESDEKIPGVSDNVKTWKWFPQQDVFGSPKLRGVIFQGGFQSTQEIVYYGIPMIGIPFYGDQARNVRKLAKEGAAVMLRSNEISFDTVYDALEKVLNDKSYQENAKRLSRITRDKIVPAKDTAIWWVEYVIRHNGAKHLRPASLQLHWFQLESYDVYLFVLTLLLIVFCVVNKIFTLVLSLIFRKSGKVSKAYKKKTT